MTRRTSLYFLIATLLFALFESNLWGQTRFRVMEWNAENAFDTLHAEGKADEEFTPAGSHRWTQMRYRAKLARMAKVVAAVGEDKPAALVALTEIENDSVLSHLTRRTRLARLGYEYIGTESEDVRGINVALLYQPHLFLPVSIDTLRFAPPRPNVRPTRDALHVAGLLTTGDTLDVIVCHLPSRKSGRVADLFRQAIGKTLRGFCDSLLCVRQKPSLILTGDFNSWFPERCLSESLGAKPYSADCDPSSLCLLSYHLKGKGDIQGTYKYQGEWNRLDHFVVSGSLLQKGDRLGELYTLPSACRIVDFDFLLQDEKSGHGVRPFRTFLGTYYQGGYSDHLPLILDLYY